MAAESRAFVHQVAGHASSIQSGPDGTGATIIKPAKHHEHKFYSTLGPSLAPDFVGEWTPQFFGMLKLEGKLAADGESVDKVEGAGEEMLVLENLTYRFLHPNVLDIKLGTQLWDEEASAEKRDRMAAVSLNTTSGKTGIRLTGFQVWDSTLSNYRVTPKEYGKSITPADLPTGMSRFFAPLIAHKNPDLLAVIVRTLLVRLEELIGIWEGLEVRMRGGSLLFVYEGDEEALEAAVRRAEQDHVRPSAAGPSASRGARQQGRGEEAEQEDETDEESDAESTDSKGDPLPESLKAFELRLIDFAHFTSAPGEGVDEGVLLGLRTTKDLLEGLLVGK